MPIFTALAGLSAATIAATAGAAGAALSGVNAYQQYESGKAASRASQQAEALRRQQMELDNRRRQTQLIRQAAIARSQSVAAATSNGALQSSAEAGGLSSIQSQAGANVLAQAENVGIGRGMFDANAALSEARANSATWSGIGDFGKALFANQVAIGSIGDTLFNGQANTGEGWSTTVRRG